MKDLTAKKKLQKVLEKVKSRAETLSDTERNKLSAEAKDNPEIIFEHIKSGHALELYCVVQGVPETLDQKDAFGMTPLHVANVDQSGLATAILTEKPHASIWERDNHGRLPLDVAEEFGNKSSIGQLTRCTYPQFILQVEDNEQERERLEKFDAVRTADKERAITTPAWLRDEFEANSFNHSFSRELAEEKEI